MQMEKEDEEYFVEDLEEQQWGPEDDGNQDYDSNKSNQGLNVWDQQFETDTKDNDMVIYQQPSDVSDEQMVTQEEQMFCSQANQFAEQKEMIEQKMIQIITTSTTGPHSTSLLHRAVREIFLSQSVTGSGPSKFTKCSWSNIF